MNSPNILEGWPTDEGNDISVCVCIYIYIKKGVVINENVLENMRLEHDADGIE